MGAALAGAARIKVSEPVSSLHPAEEGLYVNDYM